MSALIKFAYGGHMKRIRNFLPILILLLALGATAAVAQQGLAASHKPKPAIAQPSVATPPAADLAKAVARVNGIAIAERDVREQMQRLFPYYAIHGGKVPEKYQTEIRRKAIDQMVMDELIYQEAKRQGTTVGPVTTQSLLRQAKARFNSAAEYQAYAKDTYGSVANFESRIRRAAIIAKFQHNEIELKAKVAEAKVREVYEKNSKAFLRPESVWLQTISIMLPENPSAEQRKMARARIEELLPQARATKSFDEFGLLAERVSEDDYRVMMGDNKWIHTVGLPPAVEKAVKPLPPGQVSGIVELPNAYVIFRANERRPQKQMTYAEVHDRLRDQLQDAMRKHKWETMQAKLRKAARVETL